MAGGGARPGAGRPAGKANKATRELKELAQQYTGEAVITLAEIMRNDEAPAAARAHCAETLLAYGHGKPRQQHELTGKDGEPLLPAETDHTKIAVALLNVLRAAGGERTGAETGPAASE